MVDDAVEAIAALAAVAERDKVEALLAGEADATTPISRSCRAGGTESQDWAGCWRECTSVGPSGRA